MTTRLTSPVRMVINSCPSQLPIVRAAIEKMCEVLGFDARCADSVGLSSHEALTNIIRHAYHGANDKPIEIEMTPLGDGAAPSGLRICLRDYGTTVDPSKIKSRDLDDVRPGGLGVHIMSKCMDKLEYRHAEGGGTILTMVKLLPDGLEEPEEKE